MYINIILLLLTDILLVNISIIILNMDMNIRSGLSQLSSPMEKAAVEDHWPRTLKILGRHPVRIPFQASIFGWHNI